MALSVQCGKYAQICTGCGLRSMEIHSTPDEAVETEICYREPRVVKQQVIEGSALQA